MNTLRTYGMRLITGVLLLAVTHCGGGSLEFGDEPLTENPEPPAAPAQPTAPTPSSASPRLAGSTLFNLNQSRFGTETHTASSENFQLTNITFSSVEEQGRRSVSGAVARGSNNRNATALRTLEEE